MTHESKCDMLNKEQITCNIQFARREGATMAFKDFEELEKSFHAAEKKTVVVAAAQDKSALTAVRQCRKEGLLDAVLVERKP